MGLSPGRTPSTDLLSGRIPYMDLLSGQAPSMDQLSGRITSMDLSSGQAPSMDLLSGRAPSVDLLSGRVPSMDLSSEQVPSMDLLSKKAASVDLLSGQAASRYLASRQEESIRALQLHGAFLSQEKDATLNMSPGKLTSLRLPLRSDAAPDMSPGTSTSLRQSTGCDAILEVSPGKSISYHLSPVRDATLNIPRERLTSGHLYPTQNTKHEMSPRRISSLHLSPGHGTTLESLPGKLKSLYLSLGPDKILEMSPGRSTSGHLSPTQDANVEMSPRRSSSHHLSPGKDATLEMSHGKLGPIYLLPGRNAPIEISLGRPPLPKMSAGPATYSNQSQRQPDSFGIFIEKTSLNHQSPGKAESPGISPGGPASPNLLSGEATSLDVPPEKAESETLKRRAVSNKTPLEVGTHHKRSISRTFSATKKHMPATPRLDLVSDMGGIIGGQEPSENCTVYRIQAAPLSFGAITLPPVHVLSQGDEYLVDKRKQEEKRRKIGKEKQLLEIKSILSTQMNFFAERQVTGNDLRILSNFGNEDSLNVKMPLPLIQKDTNKLAVSKKIKIKRSPVPPKALNPLSQAKSNVIVRETKASELRRNVQKRQPVTRKVLPPIKNPTNPPARPIVVLIPPRRASPQDSLRSSSESPPPTPIEVGPTRPDFVPSLDLSFTLSPEDYPTGDPIPPPVFVVRETKASKLRRLKKAEDEKKANSPGKRESSTQSPETVQRTRAAFKSFLPNQTERQHQW